VLMGVTSFNPSAWLALEQQGLVQYLDAFRIGSNKPWEHHDHTQYDDAKHRVDLCKSKQMISILETEWSRHGFQRNEVMLVDDDKENTAKALKAGFRALYVTDSFLGPNWRTLHQELSLVPSPSPMQIRALTPDEHNPALLKASIALKFISKMQEHEPTKVNQALTQLGAMSKLLGPGNPHVARRKRKNEDIQDKHQTPADHSVADFEIILAATISSLQAVTQIHEKVRKVASVFASGGVEVLLQQMSPSERELCANSLASHATLADLIPDQRTRTMNLRDRFTVLKE